ncbi:hypothetical protein AHAS_Ahas13G0325400 [Arachis hypogaea]
MVPRQYVHEGDINRLNATWHVAGALDFEVSSLTFFIWHRHPTWEWVEDLLGVRPPPQPEGGKQVFGVRTTWLGDRMAHTPDGAAPETLRQYARCYLMMLIEGFSFTDKSATFVLLRWLPLLEDFDRCSWLSWGLHCSVIPTTHCTPRHCVI